MPKHRFVLAFLCTAMLSAVAAAGDDAVFFNGKDLTGWKGLPERWSVRDGAIVGSSRPNGMKGNTFLCSTRQYGDFELRFKVRLIGRGANSGVQIRSELVDPERFVVWGPQCDMGEGWWGGLFGEHFGGAKKGQHSFLQPADKEAVAKVLRKDSFNDYYIRCVGKHVTIKVNGLTTVDREFPILPDRGIIAWQLHGGGPMEVVFKDIQFKEIK